MDIEVLETISWTAQLSIRCNKCGEENTIEITDADESTDGDTVRIVCPNCEHSVMYPFSCAVY